MRPFLFLNKKGRIQKLAFRVCWLMLVFFAHCPYMILFCARIMCMIVLTWDNYCFHPKVPEELDPFDLGVAS